MGDEVESFVIGNKVCEFITMRIVRMAYNQTKALRLILETCNHRLYFKKFSKIMIIKLCYNQTIALLFF